MSTPFDPYYKWLGIARAEQPANFYRLLAVNLFEHDPEVIESAADQRTAHLQKYQNGPFAALSQRLLSEIEIAKVSLLVPQRKAAYDDALRRQAAAISGTIPVSAAGPIGPCHPEQFPIAPPDLAPPVINLPPANRVPATDAAWMNDAVELESIGICDRPAVSLHRRSLYPPLFWFVPPALGVAFLMIVILIANGRDSELVAKVASGSAHSAVAVSHTQSGDTVAGRVGPADAAKPKQSGHSNPTTAVLAASPSQSAGESEVPKPPSVDQTPSAEAVAQPSEIQASSGGVAEANVAKVPPSEDAASVNVVTTSGEPRPETPLTSPESSASSAGTGGNKPRASGKLPIPSDAAQRGALRELKDVLQEEFALAKSAAGQSSLAHQLEKLAEETRDDNVLRYVMITQALDLAVRCSETPLAAQLIDGLCESYEIELWDLRLRICNQLVHSARTLEARQNCVRFMMDLTDTALQQDKYDRAVELADLAASLAATTADGTLRERSRDLCDHVKRLQAASAEVDEAIDRLMTRPSDADASLVIGRFRCFLKNDWDTGLPYLAHGSDQELRELGEQEMRRPSAPADQLMLADAWWNLAERKPELKDVAARKPMQSRAVYWYRHALPNLNGLMALKAQKRIDEADKRATESPAADKSEHRGRTG